uniref:Uncharacterized protein n=1 Tax=Anopheles stephensi TaxID=30069 RepID=A0A182YQG0_ANOST
MNETTIGKKVRRAFNNRIESSSVSLKDDNEDEESLGHNSAAVSDDSNDDDDVGDDSDGDNSLENFVTASDDEQSTVDMRAVYLQSVRSPLIRRGGFKIVSSGPIKQQDVDDSYLDETDTHYAQEGSHEAAVADTNEEEQLLNSFIDDNIVMSLESELSELEMAERLLKERRRKNRRTRQSDEMFSAGRKTRLRQIVDSTSDSD